MKPLISVSVSQLKLIYPRNLSGHKKSNTHGDCKWNRRIVSLYESHLYFLLYYFSAKTCRCVVVNSRIRYPENPFGKMCSRSRKKKKWLFRSLGVWNGGGAQEKSTTSHEIFYTFCSITSVFAHIYKMGEDILWINGMRWGISSTIQMRFCVPHYKLAVVHIYIDIRRKRKIFCVGTVQCMFTVI